MKRFYTLTTSLLLSLSLFAQKTYTEPKLILPGHTNDIDALAVSTDLMASGSWDKNINLYKTDSTFMLVRTLTGHLAPISALRFNKSGKLLASGSSDNMIKIWDSLFRVRNFEGHQGNINCLLFDNSSKYLFSGSEDRTIIAWDVASGKPFRTITHGQSVNSLAMAGNDPRFLYVAGVGPKISVYNLANLQVTRTFDGHTDAINAIDISKNNQYLLSGSNDKTARIWDLKSGKELRKLPVDCWKVLAVAFSDDSKYAVTGCNDGSIKVWEVETGKLLTSIQSTGNVVRDVAFIKNTQLAVATMLRGSTDYGVRIWPTGITPQLLIATKIDSLKITPNNSIDTSKLKMAPIPKNKK
jgi:WD40 repeat protein